MVETQEIETSSGWWFQPTPLKNDGDGPLGRFFQSQLFMESHSKFLGSSHHQPARSPYGP